VGLCVSLCVCGRGQPGVGALRGIVCTSVWGRRAVRGVGGPHCVGLGVCVCEGVG